MAALPAMRHHTPLRAMAVICTPSVGQSTTVKGTAPSLLPEGPSRDGLGRVGRAGNTGVVTATSPHQPGVGEAVAVAVGRGVTAAREGGSGSNPSRTASSRSMAVRTAASRARSGRFISDLGLTILDCGGTTRPPQFAPRSKRQLLLVQPQEHGRVGEVGILLLRPVGQGGGEGIQQADDLVQAGEEVGEEVGVEVGGVGLGDGRVKGG